jgi:hypothetical protein
MRNLKATLALCALSAGALVYAGTGSASPLSQAAGSIGMGSQGVEKSLVIEVQRGRRGRRGRAVRGRRGRNIGAGVAAGVAIGILGAMATEAAREREMAIEDCMERYRSYNPETQTWIDRKGRVRHCP